MVCNRYAYNTYDKILIINKFEIFRRNNRRKYVLIMWHYNNHSRIASNNMGRKKYFQYFSIFVWCTIKPICYIKIFK